MTPKSFFEKYFLVATILIPLFTAWFLFMLWQTGLAVGLGKGIIAILFLGVFTLGFLVVGIIVVIRLFLKTKVWLLTQVLIVQLPFIPFYFKNFREEKSFDLNMFLYQERREQFMKNMKSDSATFGQKFALEQTEKHRLYEFNVTLSEDDYNLLNVHDLDSAAKKMESNVSIHRTCDGELIAVFMMDQAFFGDDYAIVYSERKPEKSEYAGVSENGQPYTETVYTIEKCEVEKVISSDWYYVRVPQPGMFDHIFDGMFDFGRGGGGGGSATGGCN